METEDSRPSQVMVETKPPSSSPSPGVAADGSAITGARGGPLFMPGFISPKICVRNFQGSCVTLLMAIQDELDDPLVQCTDDADLLVDDLKIISEERLVRHALQQIEEEEANEVVEGASDNLEQSNSPSSSPSHVPNESGPITNTSAESKKNSVNRKKRGRPFDRNVRKSSWEKGEEALLEESMFARLKRERDSARRNCTLRCLSSKDQLRTASLRRDSQKRLQAMNFFIAPVKVETAAVIAMEQVKDFEVETAAVIATEQVKEFEVILWIEVAKPTTRQKGQHFLLLGSQMLTTLRDKIYCITDELMRKSNTSVPSGYFRIENVYYNDMRDATAIDYSYPVLKWMHDQVLSGIRSSVNVHTADMATTQFLDLLCRVGKRYIYCHQGNCKHELIVRDLRLIHKDDIQNMLLYPLLRSPFRVRLRKCTICGIYVATKVTFDDKMAPQSPCCYCDYCYYIQHYSQDGTLLYSDFRVYEYHNE